MRWVRLAILLPVFAACATTSAELTAWNLAREVDTPAAYQDFLRKYPDSGHKEEATERIRTSKMEAIRKAGTVSECVAMLRANPDPKAIPLLEEAAYQAALKETSLPPLYEFLESFPKHPKAGEIRERAERMDYERAAREKEPEAMEYFLLRHPGSPRAAEGRRLLEEKTFLQVREWNHPVANEAFLRKFPDGPHARELRGGVPSSPFTRAGDGPEGALAASAAKLPWLKRYGCALALSNRIRSGEGNADSLRKTLVDLETLPSSAPLPQACPAVALAPAPGAEGLLAGALRMLDAVEEKRRELAGDWEVYGQRREMVKAALAASKKVADEQETAELSEEVLGRGPLGGLDVGREKASASAAKAYERFKIAESMVERDREEIRKILLETDRVYRPLRFAVTSGLVAK
ncbi:MAG: hypothetical protein Kow00128_18610 [Deltaproteobacteria bacterium]